MLTCRMSQREIDKLMEYTKVQHGGNIPHSVNGTDDFGRLQLESRHFSSTKSFSSGFFLQFVPFPTLKLSEGERGEDGLPKRKRYKYTRQQKRTDRLRIARTLVNTFHPHPFCSR